MPAERNPETNTVRLLEIASQHASAQCWAEAEQLCRQVLRMDAQQVEALKLLGAIAGSRGELERAIEIAQLQDSVKLEDLSEQPEHFADTAAAIAELNLVISVDTAVAHLARLAVGAVARRQSLVSHDAAVPPVLTG